MVVLKASRCGIGQRSPGAAGRAAAAEAPSDPRAAAAGEAEAEAGAPAHPEAARLTLPATARWRTAAGGLNLMKVYFEFHKKWDGHGRRREVSTAGIRTC